MNETNLEQIQPVPQEPVNKSVPPSVSWAKNVAQLAAIIGVTPRTVHRWRREPGFPTARSNGKWNVADTITWMQENCKGPEHDEGRKETLSEKKARYTEEQIKKLKNQNALFRKEYFPVAEGQRVIGEMIANAKKVLMPGPTALAPQVIGVPAAEAEKLIRDWLNEALTQISTNPFGEPKNNTRKSNQ